MPVQYKFGTVGATGGGFSAFNGLQVSFSETILPIPGVICNKPWQDRNPWKEPDPLNWKSSWQFSATMHMDGGGDSGQGYQIVGQMRRTWNINGLGTQSLKFIKGLCVDTTDAPLSGVTVQAFRTSDDSFAGYEVQSRTDGSYDLASNFPGVNHYVVAYLAGSPDKSGTTVNTLVPANIDGT